MDSPLMRFLSRMGDLAVLNLLWLVCCLPVVTVGASTVAMNFTAQELLDDACSGVSASFFKAFRRDWKQATVLWLIFLAAGALCTAEILILLQNRFSLVLTALCLLPPLAVLFAASYAFPLLAHFDNTTKNTLKNALLLSVGNLPRSFALGAVNLIPLALALYLPPLFLYTGAFWLFFGFSSLCYACSAILRPVLRRLEEGA